MNWLQQVVDGLIRWTTALVGRRRSEDSDRGDVPGWVMITVMTAIVVIALLVVFRDAVTNAVGDAFDKVTSAD